MKLQAQNARINTGKFFLGLGETTTQQSNVLYLDVSATHNDGELVICVVNRNKDEAITTDIISQGEFNGTFSVSEVNGPDVKSGNDFTKENIKTITKPAVSTNGSKFTYTFPPHSFTLLKGKIQK